MGLFTRKPKTPPNYDDPALDDDAWLRSGQSRYDDLIGNHYGSPDTIAAGGDQRLRQDDPAAALYFFQKSIDTLHSIYVCGFDDRGPASWSRQPGPRDIGIVDQYLSTLRQVRQRRPGAPVADSVVEVTHRLRTISTKLDGYGLATHEHRARLDDLASTAPDVDVSGVFWS